MIRNGGVDAEHTPAADALTIDNQRDGIGVARQRPAASGSGD
ncbi:hypothetical protein [Paracoccus spongiarum]|uniref:Uncharacterized protein n=1 Tax=Paracoccus spongiarum TaxID=3064387 RepID=A0ABT9JIU9_9RHOB|nr:hypothetical protein [Paracoccus sp. 2205BS29-5]MDP5308972.1 hypothetical protein [Paracoccus sp. 2205BS29-5]